MASDAPRQFHPAASLFPMLPDAELSALADSIKAHGLLEPIKVHDGKIIDGRNRMTACTLAGVQPQFKPAFVTGSAADYVFAVNDKRRHLTEGARQIAAGRYKELAAEEAKQRMTAGKKSDPPATVPEGDSRDIAGKKFNVSGKTVDRAAQVVKHGAPELVKAVESGEVPVAVAAKVAELPRREQAAAVKGGKAAVKAAAKKVDAAKDPLGPTPHQAAQASPARRWKKSTYEIYVLLNALRDKGGFRKLALSWTPDERRNQAAEIRRLIGELEKNVSILEAME